MGTRLFHAAPLAARFLFRMCSGKNTKSIFHSPRLNTVVLHVSNLADLRGGGGYKTLIWGVPFGVIISILASGVRLRLANTPRATPANAADVKAAVITI